MTESQVVGTRNGYRAVLHYEDAPSAPDGDYFGYVFHMDEWGRFECVGKAYGTPNEDFRLGTLWDQWRDMDMVERYLRIYCDVVGFDYFDNDRSKYVNVVTRDVLKLWGWDEDPAQWPHEDPAGDNLADWRAYVDGEVYYYTVERSITWTTDDADHEDDELTTWEEVDSCAGYYGREYATDAALSALQSYGDK